MPFIASTTNDWGMNLPNAQTVYYSKEYRMWLLDQKLATRYPTREAIIWEMGGAWESAKWNIVEVAR